MKVRGPSWIPVGDVRATASSRRTIRRGRGFRSGRVVVRRGASNAGLAHLRLADDSIVPPLDEIMDWIEAVRGDPSIETIRTSALFPRSADRFTEAGFAVADTLTLLRAELGSRSTRAALASPATDDAATVALRRRDYADAARVDRAAFGPEWGHDADELDEIRHATPLHRARGRVGRGGGRFRRDIEGFAVAGASSEHGYLQRLSVDPAHQRRGHGRRLTLDALHWMVRRGLPDCLVNTSVTNTAALALYDTVGFVPMRDPLRVLQLDVRSFA